MLYVCCRDVEGKKILIKAHEESLLGKDQEIARLKEHSFKPGCDWSRMGGSREEFGSSREYLMRHVLSARKLNPKCWSVSAA